MTQKLVEMSILLLFWYICHISKSTAFEEITDLAVNPKIPVTSPVDVAATDFITLVSNSHIFADKTLLINDILKSPHKAILITCPPRWGKTTNLHMLEHFLEVEVDQKGRKITPKTEAPNYKLFRNGVLKDGTKLHKPLLISKYNDLFNKFQGKYPVLYIDFSFHNIPITTLEKFQEEMRRKISTAYEHHRYMLAALKATMNSTTVTDEEKFIAIEEHEKFLVYLECRAPLDDIYGLDFLSDILSRHFKRKVFLLIDEYDHLVNHLLLESTSHDSEKIMEHYLNFLMYSIRDSEAVSKSIVTGVMTAAKNVSKFGLNNLVDHDFINGPLSHYHGYTPTEIDLINEHFKITPETRATIDSWLNGFNINTTTLFKVINPWSMNHYLKTKEFVHHDGNLTSSEPILKELLKIPEFEEAWCALLSGSNYTISVTSLKFTPKDLKGLRSMVANAKYYEDYYLRPDAVSTDIALHYLLVNGYLTLSEYQYKPPHITNISLTLTLPNHEYADKFAKYMITYYTERRIGLNPLTLDKYARDIGSSFHKLLIGKADCLPVQNILHQFLQALPLTIHIASENDTIHLRFNKNLIRSSLLFVFSRTESFHIHNSHLQRKGRRPDIILTQGSNAGALYIQYGNQPEPIGTLNHTLHTKVFRENYYFRHINTLKLVAIYVAHNKTVSVQTCNKEIGKRVKANNPANSDTMASITLAAKANG